MTKRDVIAALAALADDEQIRVKVGDDYPSGRGHDRTVRHTNLADRGNMAPQPRRHPYPPGVGGVNCSLSVPDLHDRIEAKLRAIRQPKQVFSVPRGRHSGKDVLYVEIVFCRWSGALSVGCGHYVYGCVR